MQDRSAIEALCRPLAELRDPLPIPVARVPLRSSVRPPGSKSITNRVLLLAALAGGESTLTEALVDADDARVMITALRQLGAHIDVSGTSIHVHGVNGRWRIDPGDTVRLHLGNAGTATRFLTASTMLAPETAGIVIDGDARMRERPILELVDALMRLGMRAEFLGEMGCPPLMLTRPIVDPAKSLGFPACLSMGQTLSSQFISAIMLVAPWLDRGMTIRFLEPPTSQTYIRMTAMLLRRLGIDCSEFNTESIRVPAGAPRGFRYVVEPDASGATYWAAAAAIVEGSSLEIEGLARSAHPLQGDTDFFDTVQTFGASVNSTGAGERVEWRCGLKGVTIDLSGMPDTAMTAAALACFASGVTEIRGLQTLRHKETDRLEALRNELTKLGVQVDVENYVETGRPDELMRITPPAGGIDCSPTAPRVDFDTYKDHRMAMALAIIGLRRPNVFIRDPGCVAKTYPTFFAELGRVLKESSATAAG